MFHVKLTLFLFTFHSALLSYPMRTVGGAGDMLGAVKDDIEEVKDPKEISKQRTTSCPLPGGAVARVLKRVKDEVRVRRMAINAMVARAKAEYVAAMAQATALREEVQSLVSPLARTMKQVRKMDPAELIADYYARKHASSGNAFLKAKLAVELECARANKIIELSPDIDCENHRGITMIQYPDQVHS